MEEGKKQECKNAEIPKECIVVGSDGRLDCLAEDIPFS
jgi:hypothetical protein